MLFETYKQSKVDFFVYVNIVNCLYNKTNKLKNMLKTISLVHSIYTSTLGLV